MYRYTMIINIAYLYFVREKYGIYLYKSAEGSYAKIC